MTSWKDSQCGDSRLNGRTLNDNLEVVLLKPRRAYVALVTDKLEVCGTNNRQWTLPVISWSEAIINGLGLLRGPVSTGCGQQLHGSERSTEDTKIFLVVWHGWQVSDQLTVSLWGSLSTCGIRRHLVERIQWDNIFLEIIMLAPSFSTC